jgi:hypothetical protein
MTNDLNTLRALIERAHGCLLGVTAIGAWGHVHNAMEALKDAALIAERMDRERAAQREAV